MKGQFAKRTSLAVIGVLAASLVVGQGMRFRFHDETEAAPLRLVPAVASPGQARVGTAEEGRKRVIAGNGIPAHQVGQFPNRNNPNRISAQNVRFTMPLRPKAASRTTPLEFGWNFGVTVHGIAFDPLAAEFWQGNPRSGWSYNALGGAIPLGLDTNLAHVQPTGTYHYHGIPDGLLAMLGWTAKAHSPLVGYAADGFPIYARTGIVEGKLTEMTSSYRLKTGNRPGGSAPSGRYDGTFNEDYEFVAGSGQLDECNGAWTVSADYPGGTYAYFLTDAYPAIPRCFAGSPDRSFRFARR